MLHCLLNGAQVSHDRNEPPPLAVSHTCAVPTGAHCCGTSGQDELSQPIGG